MCAYSHTESEILLFCCVDPACPEGVQDYDANFADHIVNNKKYKATHADDDEAYGLGMYEGSKHVAKTG